MLFKNIFNNLGVIPDFALKQLNFVFNLFDGPFLSVLNQRLPVLDINHLARVEQAVVVLESLAYLVLDDAAEWIEQYLLRLLRLFLFRAIITYLSLVTTLRGKDCRRNLALVVGLEALLHLWLLVLNDFDRCIGDFQVKLVWLFEFLD